MCHTHDFLPPTTFIPCLVVMRDDGVSTSSDKSCFALQQYTGWYVGLITWCFKIFVNFLESFWSCCTHIWKSILQISCAWLCLACLFWSALIFLWFLWIFWGMSHTILSHTTPNPYLQKMLSNDAHIAYDLQTNTNQHKHLAHYFLNIFCIFIRLLSESYRNPSNSYLIPPKNAVKWCPYYLWFTNKHKQT